MTFEEKVRAMSAKELIMAMVNGLRKEWVKVNMCSFGAAIDGICYGCAATNAICEIAQAAFTAETIRLVASRSKFVGTYWNFVNYLENGFDLLRGGNIETANGYFRGIEVTEISEPNEWDPYEMLLTSKNYLEKLHYFEALAEYQDTGTFEPEKFLKQ